MTKTNNWEPYYLPILISNETSVFSYLLSYNTAFSKVFTKLMSWGLIPQLGEVKILIGI